MNRKTAILATLAATLMLGTSAVASFARPDSPRDEAHGRPGMRAMMFVHMLQELDTNKDGKISKEEAQAGTDKRFAEVDADKDGVLIPGEMRKYHEAKREEWRTEREKAREGQQTAEGGPAAPDAGPGPDGPRGPRHDDRDGAKAHGKWGEGKWHEHAGRGPEHGRPGWGGRDEADNREGHHNRPMGMRMIRVADTDENGQISKQEATAMADKMFERMDTNKDGFISADDMPKRPSWHR